MGRGRCLGTKAIVEGRRAAREAVRANAALADLKKSAPSMLALAGSEAVAQHFESELEKTGAALSLDPGLLPAYWRRAWCFVALGRFSDAASALRIAGGHDPANARELGAILPQIEKIAAIPDEPGRYAPDLLTPVFEFLQTHDASGEAGALIEHLRLTTDRRLALGKDRIKSLGGAEAGLFKEPSGLIRLDLTAAKLHSLEQMRGIPCDILTADKANIESLEPLRNLHLSKLIMGSNPISDLAPLRGMALVELNVSGSRVSDLSPLAEMPLRILHLSGCTGVVDLAPLRGMHLEHLEVTNTGVAEIGPLAGMPLRNLSLAGTKVHDLQPLAGMPLEMLYLHSAHALSDLSPLAGLPLKELGIRQSANLKDLTPLLRIATLERLETDAPSSVLAPLRQHPRLAFVNYQQKGYRPAAEVWAELDAQPAAEKK